MLQVWIDLEETIINNWNDGLFIYHVDTIRTWCKYHKLENINIYSFAIYDDKDKEHFFSSGMKASIELALDCSILEYPSIAEIQHVVSKYEGIKYDSRFEFMQLNGKHWSFIKYCMLAHQGKHNVLIDDAIPTWTICDNKTNTSIDLINIVDLMI